MINLFTLQATSDPDVFRYVDVKGDWKYYYIQSQNRFVKAVNHIIDTGWPKGEGFKQYLLNNTQESADKILQSAGEEGSRTHLAIDLMLKGETVSLDTLLPNRTTGKPEAINMEEWKNILAFKKFWEDYKPELVCGEKTVVGYGGPAIYAGTLDAIIKLNHEGEDKVVLIDWKTSSGIWSSYWGQVASYFYARNGYNDIITHTGILRMGTRHKNGYMGGAGYELAIHDIEGIMDDKRIFDCARQISDYEDAGISKMDTTSIPTEVSIEVKNYVPSQAGKGEANAKSKERTK